MLWLARSQEKNEALMPILISGWINCILNCQECVPATLQQQSNFSCEIVFICQEYSDQYEGQTFQIKVVSGIYKHFKSSWKISANLVFNIVRVVLKSVSYATPPYHHVITF